MDKKEKKAYFLGIGLYAIVISVLVYALPQHSEYIIGSMPYTGIYCIIRLFTN